MQANKTDKHNKNSDFTATCEGKRGYKDQDTLIEQSLHDEIY